MRRARSRLRVSFVFAAFPVHRRDASACAEKTSPAARPRMPPFVKRGCRSEARRGIYEVRSPVPPASEHNKKPVLADRFLMLALSIFPGSRPPSIVDGTELNFCVRDGNRWTLRPINANFVGRNFAFSLPSQRLRRRAESSTAPFCLLSKSQTLRWFVILGQDMYPENRTQQSAIMILIRHPSLRIKVKPSAY